MKFRKNRTNASAAEVPFAASLIHSQLFRKYFLIIALLILITTSLSGILMMRLVSDTYRKQELNELHITSSQIAETASELISGTEGSSVTDYQNALEIICYTVKNVSENSDADVFITDSAGHVIICKELLNSVSTLVVDGKCTVHGDMEISETQLNNILSGKKDRWLGNLHRDGRRDHYIAASPLYIVGADDGDYLMGYVFSVKDNAPGVRAALRTLRMQFLISAAFALVFAFIIIYIILYRFAKPFKEMLYATRLYAKGDFSYRIKETNAGDEIRELIRAFNSMANDLSAIETSRRNFVANVSHELKTPMTTIGGFIDGILDGTIPPAAHKKYLGIVSDEVRRLSRLISSMLNMSKIEAGELTPAFTQFSASEMIVRTFLSFEQLISQNNIEIEGLDMLENITVSADPDMINQVIYNIIDNAVKFTPKSGRIAARCYREADKAIIKIRNYGVGIANEELKMVFDRFYKVDKSRSLNTKSVGLGLYICKNIVELHNGRIYAASEDNNYTEFTVELPIRQ
ncbi:MAG: HAMP domain-containing histidine kinase [Clostridia bacterium]|nr:HAMP domain-containing histidine kinase [Clostridia bacterium]